MKMKISSFLFCSLTPFISQSSPQRIFLSHPHSLTQVRNVVFEPLLLPGGGATEMCVAQELARCGPLEMVGVQRWPFVALGKALEVIPRTLAQNCGANVIRQMTVLRAKHRNLEGEGG
jgi:chaperonin GroEL (HSP60 family)